MNIKAFVFLVMATLLLPVSGNAQEGGLNGEFSATASIKSDYRFRGVSRSDNDFAVQGSVDYFTDSGFYAGAFASNVSGFNGADLETNLYLGYEKEVDGIIYDVGVTGYMFPGGPNTSYIETYGSVGIDYGLLTSSVGLAYAFSNDNLGQDNIYLFGDTRASIPDTPFALVAHIGYEDGFFGDGKWDWKLGASVTINQFELSVDYIDTNQVGERSDAGVIFGLSAYF